MAKPLRTSAPTARPKAGSTAAEDVEPAERIIAAAYGCFERYGVPKTTIEDIAASAGLSRPTVYKHFLGKDDIVNRICALESYKVNAEIRKRIRRQALFADTLTDCLVVCVRMGSENPYVRRFLESIEVSSRSADPANPVHKVQRDRWDSLLLAAIERGEMAHDISLDEAVSWLTLSQCLLLIKVDAIDITDQELGRFIRRFIVAPLLARGGPSAAATS